jgi:hypothetical protein
MYHGFCNTGGCHIDAKASTAVTTIPRAQATGNLEVVTRATVTTIEVDRKGRASGVRYICGGNLWVMSDRRPISASAMNTFGYAPNWGSQWKGFIKQNADRYHSSYIQKTTHGRQFRNQCRRSLRPLS